jgi:hypothetical protein
MPILQQGSQFLFVRMDLDPAEIPNLLAAHRKHWKSPERLEAEGARLVAQGFPDTDTGQFAHQVVEWGGGHRFVDRFRQKNTDQKIASALRHAADLANNEKPTLAVSHVQQLDQLGQSFASKLVRFICPTRAVILDDVIRSSLGYRNSPDGYEEFLRDCQFILEKALPEFPELRVCDVEAAIFAKLQGYSASAPI